MTEPTEPQAPEDATGDATGDAPLDAARESAVRRLLAEVSGPEPLPREVAARLDDRLAALVAERGSVPVVSHPESHGVVVPLDAAARRRRVRVRVLLGAAAAVVVVGVGIGAVGGGLGDSGSDTLSAADEMAEDDPARSPADASEAGGLAEADDADVSGAPEAPEGYDASTIPEPSERVSAPRRVDTDGPVREVHADRLREDLVALQHALLPRPSDADYSATTLAAPADFTCEPAAFGSGYLVGVEYDGLPAVVAFRAPVGSTQAAEVIACGSGDVLHSTTLPTTG